MGEFNSGKSTCLNALLGDKFLQSGVIPTTSHIDVLKYGKEVAITEETKTKRVIQLPVEWLKEISLVDTPGTNAVNKIHQQITEEFLPRSDMVLWCTSVDRAFSESERQFLEIVKNLRKKIIVILSKVDIVDTLDEVKQIENFVRSQFQKLLEEEPLIFPCSPKKALKAKQQSKTKAELAENENWKISRFGELESYILSTLSAVEKAQLKFKNPIGICLHITFKYSSEIEKRQAVLKEDLDILARIDRELQDYKKDMITQFENHIYRIDNVLLHLAERANEFISNEVSITNIVHLMTTDNFKQDFKTKVIGKSREEIDKYIEEIVDWILVKNGKQWTTVTEYLTTRSLITSYQLLGKVQSAFTYNRESLLTSISTGASKVLNSFDTQKEGERLSEVIKAGIYQTVMAEFGAVGVGTLLASSLFDVSGILPAGALAITGFAILPYHRSSLQSQFKVQIELLRVKMTTNLRNHFEEQVDDGILKMRDNISPYTRFVNTQVKELETTSQQLKQIQTTIAQLNARIATEFVPTQSANTNL